MTINLDTGKFIALYGIGVFAGVYGGIQKSEGGENIGWIIFAVVAPLIAIPCYLYTAPKSLDISEDGISFNTYLGKSKYYSVDELSMYQNNWEGIKIYLTSGRDLILRRKLFTSEQWEELNSIIEFYDSKNPNFEKI